MTGAELIMIIKIIPARLLILPVNIIQGDSPIYRPHCLTSRCPFSSQMVLL